MTHPIPGADSERALFEAKTLEQFAAATFDKLPPGSYRVGWVQDQWIGWQTGRAAAKVGANVAAESIGDDECFLLLVRRWLALKATKCGSEAVAEAFKQVVGHIDARLAAGAPSRERSPYVLGVKPSNWAEQVAAGAPAETPKPLYFVRPAGETWWKSASEEAYWLFSEKNRRILYEAAQHSPAPIAGDVEKDALIKALTDIKEMTDCDNPESYRYDDREGCLDAVFSTASGALAAMLANSSSGEAG